jgi:hypothetical protein
MQHLIVPPGSCNSVTLGTAGLQSKPAPAWSRNRSIVYIGLQHVHAWAVKFARLPELLAKGDGGRTPPSAASAGFPTGPQAIESARRRRGCGSASGRSCRAQDEVPNCRPGRHGACRLAYRLRQAMISNETEKRAKVIRAANIKPRPFGNSIPVRRVDDTLLHCIVLFRPAAGVGHSLQIGARRKSLHVCNAPKATAGGQEDSLRDGPQPASRAAKKIEASSPQGQTRDQTRPFPMQP